MEIVTKITYQSTSMSIVSYKMYVAINMSSKTLFGKNLDGLDTGNFDSLFVAGDSTMGGNLSVDGIITGTVVTSSNTANYFVGTDSSNQYRTSSSTFDLKSTTASPTFRFRNSSDSTSSSTIDVGSVQTVSVGTTSVTASGAVSAGSLSSSSTASVTGLLSSGSLSTGAATVSSISSSGTVTAPVLSCTSLAGTSANLTGSLTSGSFSTGAATLSSATVSGLTTTGTLSTGTITGTNGSFTGTVSANALSTTTSLTASTAVISGSISGNTISLSSTTNATAINTGAISTPGGVGITKDVYIGGKLYIRPSGSVGAELTYDGTQTALYSFDRGLAQYKKLNIQDALYFEAGTLQAQFIVTTNSTSTSTGAVVITGGAAIQKNVNIGQSLTVVGSLTAQSTVAITSNLTVGGTATITGNVTMSGTQTTTGIAAFNSTQDYTRAGNGSVKTLGGVYAAKKVYASEGFYMEYSGKISLDPAFTYNKILELDFSKVGGLGGDATYLYSAGSGGTSGPTYVIAYNTDQVKLNVTTASTSTTTGALVVSGGVGIAGNVYIGGTLTAGAVVYASTSSGTFDVTNGTGKTFTVQSTQSSTSTTTGCATFAGGVGVAENLYVGGTLSAGSVTYASTSTGTMTITSSPGTTLDVQSTQASTSTTTGCSKFAGGIGVAKGIYMGEDIVMGLTAISATRLLSIQNTSSNSSAKCRVELSADTATGQLTVNSSTAASRPNQVILKTNNSAGIHIHNSNNVGIEVDDTSVTLDLNTVVSGSMTANSIYVQNGLWSSNGNDIFLSANTSSIYLRPTVSSPNGQMEHTTTASNIYNTSGSVIWSTNKSSGLTTLTKMTVSDTTAATSSSTGSVTLAGGLAISNTTDATSSTNGGSLTSAGGFAFAKSGYIDANLTVTGTLTVGTFSPSSITTTTGNITTLNTTTGNITNVVATTATLASTTASTSVSTGALITQGGIAINNATDATSTTNGGSLTSAGGFAFAKSGYVGGSLTVSGTTTSGTVTATTLNLSGTANMRLFAASGTSDVDPGFTFTNTQTDNNTNTFFQSNLTDGKEMKIMFGNSIASMQCGKVTYKYTTSDATKQVKLGFYGQEALVCQNGDGGSIPGGLSIYGGPFFTFTEGTWTPSLIFGTGSPLLSVTSTSYWMKMGRHVTISAYIDFSYAAGQSGNFYISNPPFATAYTSSTYPLSSAMCVFNTTALDGLSSPYQVSLEYQSGGVGVYILNGTTYYRAQILGASSQKINFTLTYILPA